MKRSGSLRDIDYAAAYLGCRQLQRAMRAELERSTSPAKAENAITEADVVLGDVIRMLQHLAVARPDKAAAVVTLLAMCDEPDPAAVLEWEPELDADLPQDVAADPAQLIYRTQAGSDDRPAGSEALVVRAWARRRGLAVGGRGRLSGATLEKYRASEELTPEDEPRS